MVQRSTDNQRSTDKTNVSGRRPAKGPNKLVHIAVAGLILSGFVGGFVWLVFSSSNASEPASRQKQAKADLTVGHVVVTDGENCKTKTFDNTSGSLTQGDTVPCGGPGSKGYRPPATRLEAVRKSFSSPNGNGN